jgi:hypothetical protein
MHIDLLASARHNVLLPRLGEGGRAVYDPNMCSEHGSMISRLRSTGLSMNHKSHCIEQVFVCHRTALRQ